MQICYVYYTIYILKSIIFILNLVQKIKKEEETKSAAE